MKKASTESKLSLYEEGLEDKAELIITIQNLAVGKSLVHPFKLMRYRLDGKRLARINLTIDQLKKEADKSTEKEEELLRFMERNPLTDKHVGRIRR